MKQGLIVMTFRKLVVGSTTIRRQVHSEILSVVVVICLHHSRQRAADITTGSCMGSSGFQGKTFFFLVGMNV